MLLSAPRCITALFLFSIFLSSPFVVRCNPFPNSVQLDGAGKYNLSWGIGLGGTSITMRLDLAGKAWVGLGWHGINSSAQLMQNADFVIATFDSETGALQSVSDRTSDKSAGGYAEPLIDTTQGGQDNILSASGNQLTSGNGTGGVITTVTFTRPLLTNDTCCDHNISKGDMNLIWAYGSSNTLGFHGPNAGSLQVNFYTGTVASAPSSPSNVLKKWHGSLMFLAFGILMPIAIFVSRFTKKYWWWLYVHIGANTLAILLALVAFVLIIVAVQQMHAKHFDNVHARLGLATLILVVMPPFWGALALWFWNPERKRAPIFPDMIHWWSGRIPVILGIAAIFLGMEQLGVSNVLRYVFGILIGCYATAYIFIDLTRIYDWIDHRRSAQQDKMAQDTPHASGNPVDDGDYGTYITGGSHEMYHSSEFNSQNI